MVKTRKTIAFILAAVFVSYCTSMTFFSHTHVIDGATIVHSHFHFDSHHDTKSGGHTTLSITLIAQLAQFDCTGFAYDCDFNASPLAQYERDVPESGYRAESVYLKNLSLRAPPRPSSAARMLRAAS